MKHTDEEELIAYHLGELSRWRSARMRRRLEHDVDLARQSEGIAATLRAFAADVVPAPGNDVAERSWQRMRGAMLVYEPHMLAAGRGVRGRFWAGAGVGALATAALVTAFVLHSVQVVAPSTLNAANGLAPAKSWSNRMIDELHMHKPKLPASQQLNQRPGPLTTAPVDAVADDPALATHLDTAERVLTEVSHTDGPLSTETRDQVHRLLLNNAVYHHSAEQRGDMATAAVIDDLGRVLISLDAEPQDIEVKRGARPADAFRLQMNIGGVLLDLRILHHNDAAATPRSAVQ